MIGNHIYNWVFCAAYPYVTGGGGFIRYSSDIFVWCQFTVLIWLSNLLAPVANNSVLSVLS